MSTSHIVPYYSSSPPPLDEDDDTAHSLDADDDDFGDFSSAPTANTAVDITKLKSPTNESAFFRPISTKLEPDVLNDNQSADDYESDEPPNVFGAKSEPVNRFSPVFTNDQFLPDHRKGDDWLHSISAGKEDVINENADNDSNMSSESNCLRETSNTNERKSEETSDFSDSANFASFDGENVLHCDDPVKREEEEDPVVNEVLTDQCSFTGFASINSQDTVTPDALKVPVQENFGPNSVQDTNKDVLVSAVFENVAKDESDDFESFHRESALKDNQLDSVVSETTADDADVSVSVGQENVVACVPDVKSALKDNQLDSVVSETTADDAYVSVNGGQENVVACVPDVKCNIKTSSDVKEFQAVDEFDDFESFQVEFPVKPDSAVTKANYTEAEVSVNKVQDDFAVDAPNNKCKIDAMNDFREPESATESDDDFESFQDELVAKDSEPDPVVSKTDSDNAEISVKIGQERIAADASEENMNVFEQFKDVKKSAEDMSLENVSGNELETQSIQAVESRKSGEKNSSLSNDEFVANEKSDFDEFDEFQFASGEVTNMPTSTGYSMAVSTATTFKTGDSSSSWSAFSKEPLSDEPKNENLWAAFDSPPTDVVTNASPSVVQTEKQATSVTAEEELKSPVIALKDSSTTKTTAEGSQVKFEMLTSRVVTNCYPLVKEMDAMQLQLLSDLINKPHELTDNPAKSFHTQNLDLTTGENKSCLRDVCVWNNLKMMDLTSAFSFQWPTSSISRNLLGAIDVDLSSILVGHKKPQAPLFAPNLGLLEPMKAPTELQITQAGKDPLTFAASDSSSSSSGAMSSAFSPQDVPQLVFDWGGSGLTNPLDAGNSFQLDLDFFVMSGHNSMVSEATEKERELLDALEPPASDLSMKMPPMSLETMMATLLPSIPSTQLKPQKDVDRKHLSKEAIQVLSKLPDLSFMQAKVLMFPLKDIASN